jgi:hypothetical protein
VEKAVLRPEAEGNGEGRIGAGFGLAPLEWPIWPFEAGLVIAVRLDHRSLAPSPVQHLNFDPKKSWLDLGCNQIHSMYAYAAVPISQMA